MPPQPKARVLLIHRFYWPDTPPYGHILRQIALRLGDDGHDVEVLSTQPCYKATSKSLRQPRVSQDGPVRITRMRLGCEVGRGGLFKIWNVLRYLLGITLFVVRRRRFDIVMTATTPAVFAGLAGRIAARLSGARLIYHCMDLHPELARCSGVVRSPLANRMLDRIERKTRHRAARIIVLSEDMRQTLLESLPELSGKVHIFNNFTTPNEGKEAERRPESNAKGSAFKIIYAGNVGRFQGLETLLEALGKVESTTDVELQIVGDGKALEGLKQQAAELKDQRIEFLPHQSAAAAAELVRNAQMGFISLQPEIIRYAYPSKTMFYLEEGTPLLCAVEPDSELGRLVVEAELGIVVPPDDADALAEAIRTAVTKFSASNRSRSRIKQIAEDQFGRSTMLDRWSEFFAELSA
ncbi:MAG: glycosyltransferase family 4 protein [Phycisphaerales bacterium]|nr:glycosyltransferase family 4 protein [Phycisphaerales bacterium]